MRGRDCFVYIMASMTGVLYVGVTSHLEKRAREHKNGVGCAFTKKYRCHRLVYFEAGSDILSAIGREKQLKGLMREKKLALIRRMNPRWEDLAERFEQFDQTDPSLRSG